MTKLYVPLRENRNFDLANATFSRNTVGPTDYDYFTIDVDVVERKFYWYTNTSNGRRYIKLTKNGELKIIKESKNDVPTKLTRNEFSKLASENGLKTQWVYTRDYSPLN